MDQPNEVQATKSDRRFLAILVISATAAIISANVVETVLKYRLSDSITDFAAETRLKLAEIQADVKLIKASQEARETKEKAEKER